MRSPAHGTSCGHLPCGSLTVTALFGQIVVVLRVLYIERLRIDRALAILAGIAIGIPFTPDFCGLSQHRRFIQLFVGYRTFAHTYNCGGVRKFLFACGLPFVFWLHPCCRQGIVDQRGRYNMEKLHY